MSETQQRDGDDDLSFRDRSDREKIQALTDKYGPDTDIGRLARNVLAELDHEGGGDV